MTKERLLIGDVVTLNSGGQLMTVEQVDEPLVRVVWFEKRAEDMYEYHYATFLAAMLTKVVTS